MVSNYINIIHNSIKAIFLKEITQSMIESVTVKTTPGHNLCYQFPQNLFDIGVCQNTQNIEESFVSKFGSGYR